MHPYQQEDRLGGMGFHDSTGALRLERVVDLRPANSVQIKGFLKK